MAEKESFQMTLPASEIDAALLAAKTAVSYEPQTVPPEKQAQARTNIGAAPMSFFNIVYGDSVDVLTSIKPAADAFTEGKYCSYENGNIYDVDNYCCTEGYIDFPADARLRVSDSAATHNQFYPVVVYYDGGKNYIGGERGSEFSNVDGEDYAEYNVPADTRFIRLSVPKDKINEFNKVRLSLDVVTQEKKASGVEIPNLVLPKSALHYPLKGKVIVNFGDSIFGNFDAPTDISSMIADLTGATVHNCGFGGCRMASHPTTYYDAFSMYRLSDAIATQDYALQDQAIIDGTAELDPSSMLVTKFPIRLALLKTIDFNEVDIITIAYGANDHNGYPMLDNEDKPTDTDYIAGALRYSIEKLLTAYPHLKIFICAPLYKCWNNEDGTLNYDSDTNVKNGLLLVDVVNKEKSVADEYHLPFIDNYHNIGINKVNRLNYFTIADGAHPNEAGRKLIAEHIAHELF